MIVFVVTLLKFRKWLSGRERSTCNYRQYSLRTNIKKSPLLSFIKKFKFQIINPQTRLNKNLDKT